MNQPEYMMVKTANALPRWVTVVVTLCGAVSFYFSLQSGFIDDDFIQLWNARLPLWDALQGCFTSPDMFFAEYFRPMTRVVHRMLFAIFDSTAIGHHAFSIALHLVNSLLAYHLFRRLGAPANVSRLSALIFVIHPVQVETVTFISAMGGILAGTSVLLALMAYLRFTNGDGSLWGALAMLAGGVGLLCKEDVISIPISFAVLWWFYSHNRRRQWWPIAGMVPIIGAWLVWRVAIGGVLGPAAMGFSANPLTILRNVSFHLVRLAVSVRTLFRTMDFDWYYRLRDAMPPTPDSGLYIGVVLLIAGGIVYWIWRNCRAWPRYVQVGFLLSLATVSLYLPLPQSATRFLYLPVAGFALGIVGLAMTRYSRFTRIALISWLVILSVSTVEQTSTWYQARRTVNEILAQAVLVRSQHPPGIGTVFLDYPMRHYAAFVFASGLPDAVRWQTDYDWPYIYGRRDTPIDPQESPDSLVWYGWQAHGFVPVPPRNP